MAMDKRACWVAVVNFTLFYLHFHLILLYFTIDSVRLACDLILDNGWTEMKGWYRGDMKPGMEAGLVLASARVLQETWLTCWLSTR